MRKVTIQLFQLFLSIFIIYAMFLNFPKNLLVPLLCLVCMFLTGKWKKASDGEKASDGGSDIPTYREPDQPDVFLSGTDF